MSNYSGVRNQNSGSRMEKRTAAQLNHSFIANLQTWRKIHIFLMKWVIFDTYKKLIIGLKKMLNQLCSDVEQNLHMIVKQL